MRFSAGSFMTKIEGMLISVSHCTVRKLIFIYLSSFLFNPPPPIYHAIWVHAFYTSCVLQMDLSAGFCPLGTGSGRVPLLPRHPRSLSVRFPSNWGRTGEGVSGSSPVSVTCLKKSPSSVEREPWNALNCWAPVSHSHLFPWKPHPQQPDNGPRYLAGVQIAAYSLQWANYPALQSPCFLSFHHLPFLFCACLWKPLVKASWKDDSALINWISWQSPQSSAQCFSAPLKSLR